jgi:hypothetical protein
VDLINVTKSIDTVFFLDKKEKNSTINDYLVVPEKVIWCYKFWAYLVAI